MKIKNITLIVSTILALAVSYWLLSPLWKSKTLTEPLPIQSAESTQVMPQTLTQEGGLIKSEAKSLVGSFINGVHEVSGTAKVINTNDGKVLRLEDFKSVNGPDLFVYLATDNNAKEYVNLGSLKANIGNLNYSIPAGTDITKYKHVLIWCKSFSVLFGSAELK